MHCANNANKIETYFAELKQNDNHRNGLIGNGGLFVADLLNFTMCSLTGDNWEFDENVVESDLIDFVEDIFWLFLSDGDFGFDFGVKLSFDEIGPLNELVLLFVSFDVLLSIYKSFNDEIFE